MNLEEKSWISVVQAVECWESYPDCDDRTSWRQIINLVREYKAIKLRQQPVFQKSPRESFALTVGRMNEGIDGDGYGYGDGGGSGYGYG